MAYVVGVDAVVTPGEILLRYAGSDRVELRTLHAPNHHWLRILSVQVRVVLQIGGLRLRDPAEGEAIVLLHKEPVGEVGGGAGSPALVQSERHSRSKFI